MLGLGIDRREGKRRIFLIERQVARIHNSLGFTVVPEYQVVIVVARDNVI